MQKNKIFHILSYITVLFIISLFIPEKDNKAVKFHCGQGMILTILDIAAGIVLSILGSILGWIAIIGVLLSIISTLVGIAVLVLIIIGIVNAINDKEEPLPVIGKYAFYK